MNEPSRVEGRRSLLRLPVVVRSIVAGLLITMIGIYPWGAAVYGLGPRIAIPVTLVWLGLFATWTSGRLPPRVWREARRGAFRSISLGGAWGFVAALAFAVTVEAGLLFLFRLTPFPREAFRTLQAFPDASPFVSWVAIATAALVAGVGEEIGFRGYMQQPIEAGHGALLAILVSSALFTAFHLNQAWATPAMLPVIFAAGALLGVLAWASGSLLPGIIGHTVMDVGNFAYWWTGMIGDYDEQPISVTGVDRPFLVYLVGLIAGLALFLLAVKRLNRGRASRGPAFTRSEKVRA